MPDKILAQLPAQELASPALFGTLSFPVRSGVPEYDYTLLIYEIVRRRHPALLLCAGWSLIDETVLPVIKNATQTFSSVVLVETMKHPGETTTPQSYRIAAGQIAAMGQQYFTTRNDRTNESVCDLANAVTKRQFRFDRQSDFPNCSAFLLVCGELGVVVGRNNVAFHPLVSKAPALLRALNDATIILNPTHTRMGNAGTLKAKRGFLSRNKRIYVSTSNWDLSKGQNISSTLHSLWYDGCERTQCLSIDSEYFCYREWNITE